MNKRRIWNPFKSGAKYVGQDRVTGTTFFEYPDNGTYQGEYSGYCKLHELHMLYRGMSGRGKLRDGFITTKQNSTGPNYSLRLSSESQNMLNNFVPKKYRSPFIEMCVRIVISIMSDGEDLDAIAVEWSKVDRSPYTLANLGRMRNTLSKLK